MKNYLVAYVKEYRDVKFEQASISEADFLILSQLSYVKFDHVVASVNSEKGRPLSLWEIDKMADRDVLFADEKYREDNEALFDAMLESRRYEDIRILFYENRIDDELQMQFSAMTVMIDQDHSVIVYRGTDEYLISWKEDFNLSFWKKVPGQMRALEYLNEVAGKISGDFWVCGHSKGGNFSVYASMCAAPEVQKRITDVYSFDGPGFRQEILEEKHYDHISYKVHKVVPRASLVGMLFETDDRCKVVDSTATGILQHNLHTWIISKGQLKQVDKITESTRYMDERINEWIGNLSMEERKIFTDTLFEVAFAGETENLREIAFDIEGIKKANQVLNAAKNLEPETKEKIQKIMKELVKVTMDPFIGKIGKSVRGRNEDVSGME